MWAVTIIGAPKKAAAQAIEDLEKDARGWYGGAVGMLSLNGDINTGILDPHRASARRHRALQRRRDAALRFGSGARRAGNAPEGHRLFPRAARSAPAKPPRASIAPAAGQGMKLLLVDNDDCFIHTLSNYARQTGAEVVTYRAGVPHEMILDSRRI